jgi:UDP-N-acetyl-D-mannosaminuronate dehydrogenase
LKIFDSWVTSENTVASLDDCIDQVKAIVIVTEHSDVIAKLVRVDLSALGVEVVVDGRNCLVGERVQKQNILYRGMSVSMTVGS